MDSLARMRASSWLESFPIIGGHFLWEHVDNLVGGRATTAVVLRDPVERALSHFAFNRQNAEAFPLQMSGRDSLNHALRRVLERGPREQLCLLSNLQTGILAGYARGSADPFERLEAAKENLARIDVVGVTERLGEFRSAIASGLDKADLPAIPHENRTPSRLRTEELPSGTLEFLRQANGLDTELYQFALGRAQRLKGGPEAKPGRVSRAGLADSYGNRACTIESIHAEAMAGVVLIRGQLHATEAGDYNCGVLIVDENGTTICGTNTAALGCRLRLEAGERRVLDFEVVLSLAKGRYTAYCEIVEEFSVCHRPLAGAEINIENEAHAGVGLCRPLVKLRQSSE